MPRTAKPKAPGVRSDGEATAGNIKTPGQGQPNGRPRAAVTQALAGAGAGGSMPYGMKGQLQQAAADTPAPPPGISPDAHAAHMAVKAHLAANPVTPLFAPTQNPMEPVTAGAPLDAGPTNPMALPPTPMGQASVADILQQAAQASGSPALLAMAQRASAIAGSVQGQPPA